MLYHRSRDVTWELADDRAVILDAGGSTLTTLNTVGTLIWRYLDEPRQPADVAALLANDFPTVDHDELVTDASAFLSRLADEGLVVAADARG